MEIYGNRYEISDRITAISEKYIVTSRDYDSDMQIHAIYLLPDMRMFYIGVVPSGSISIQGDKISIDGKKIWPEIVDNRIYTRSG